MRLIRFGTHGLEKPGILDANGIRRDLSIPFADFDSRFFSAGGLGQLRSLATHELEQFPIVAEGERWGAPIARPGKHICIGLNYSDHAKESGMPIPTEPVIFLKASNTVVGPYDDVVIPRRSTKTDWEAELGVVIGKEARYLSGPDQAGEYIAGYCLSNDVSEREFQLERGGQWTKGKSCDTFNPLGPWLVTPEELGDVRSLEIHLWVNGEQRQNGTTRTMIFDVPMLVHYLSQFMSLEPGDLISTGTPPGVGFGMKPPRYLRPGDTVECDISGLGKQRQHFRSAYPPV